MSENIWIWLPLLVFVVAVGLVLREQLTASKPVKVTMPDIVQGYTKVLPLAKEISEVALTAVQASEQLYLTGKIERDERFEKAVEHVTKWYPNLDSESLITVVESAVFELKKLKASQTPEASQTSGTSEPLTIR